ncbi:IclR family transcriptional regulator [Marivibrio halodurans]|uniref:IclR family transcriptional regulator n=1 Tax=Marivibrio halodurans TaxID=2039722 RepID=A0A8J7S1R6_9PROT|nr:IclR family transcriptional regulator [Marivibrio halodurans]MBP5858280.1 IclR family transcriptional regulator [Marivibrio halodurans]
MASPDDTPPPAGRRGIQSAGTAVDVLTAMARARGPVTLGDLARMTGMTASTLHRYLASFLEKGLVVQQGRSGAYDLGRLAVEIGLAALNRSRLVNDAADALPDLARATGTSALLSVWGPEGATIVRIERSERLVATALGLGTRLPLLTSATGQVFLAHLPDALSRSELTREQAAGVTGIKTPEAIRAAVRGNGYAWVDSQFLPGLAAIAAPILDWQGYPEATASLISTDPAITRPDSPVVAALKRFAADLGATSINPASGA